MDKAQLQRGRDGYRRRAWNVAYRHLSRADQAAPLEAGDLERLATSAYLTGRESAFHEALDRAHRARVQEDDPPGAARCAFWLGLTLLLRGETARASGWLSRARRLVEGRECVEHGYLLLPEAERHLRERNGHEALATATRAAGIGDRFGDADLISIARHLQGRAVIQEGEIQRGLALLDEAMIAVTGSELSPIVTGLIYCSVIDACRQVFASGRAREWTLALTLWCEQQPEMVAFNGTCRVHRAEVLQLGGAWNDAMEEARRAGGSSARAGEGRPPAEAFYRQGEIHRLRGEFGPAEQAYRNASRLGLEPHPGLALLRLARGHADAALAAMRRVLAAADGPLHRARLLPAAVEISLGAGDVSAARSASRELDGLAGRYATPAAQATAAQARAAVLLAEGQAQAALGALREASDLWQEVEAPYETARCRLLMARACRELGDNESAELEFDAARELFERLGAAADLDRLHALRHRPAAPGTLGLSSRESQVLRRIAAGKTNRAIAAELSVSERTIDRHVSNILTKLRVPSRAAAAARAIQHKLLD